MALQDILDMAFSQEASSGARAKNQPHLAQTNPFPAAPPQTPLQAQPAPQGGGMASLLPMLLSAQQGGGGGAGGGAGNIDPSLDLMTRRGVTLDEDALHSLLQARRAGFNAFPYIGSDYRSTSEQRDLWNNRGSNSLPVARPGSSLHEQGLAFDAGSLPADIRRYLTNHGWYWGQSFGDPVHYSYGELG